MKAVSANKKYSRGAISISNIISRGVKREIKSSRDRGRVILQTNKLNESTNCVFVFFISSLRVDVLRKPLTVF